MTGSGKPILTLLMLLGSLNDSNLDVADGIVRLYRNYDPTLQQGPLQMVSAFRALNEMVQLRQGSGIVMDWKQPSGTLLVGGDSRVIKVWDAQTETQGLVRLISLQWQHCSVPNIFSRTLIRTQRVL